MNARSRILVPTLVLVLSGFAVAKDLKDVRIEDLPPVDYKAYAEVLPAMDEISKSSVKSLYEINKLLIDLLQETSDTKAEKLRASFRPLLTRHREMKVEMIALIDRALKRAKPTMSDLDALRAIHNTNLRRVNWNNVYLKNVIRDISENIGVPMRLNARIQELNYVDISFGEINAEAVLNLICNNFDYKWIIYGGEIHLFPRINRNEERCLDYESRHGKVDWISEAELRFAKDVEIKTPKRELKAVENMDLPLLKASLLKLYVMEGESKRHEAHLEQLEMMASLIDRWDERDHTEEERQVRVKRHKHILHYLYMERDNAIEVWDVLNRVLGDYLVLEDEDATLRKLLDTEIESLEWANVPLEDALTELGRLMGVGVDWDLPPRTDMRVDLTVENVTAETVIGIICEIHPLDWQFVNGRFFFAHRDK